MKEFTDEHICIWKGGDRELEDVLKIFGGEKEKAKRYAGEGERTLSFCLHIEMNEDVQNLHIW